MRRIGGVLSPRRPHIDDKVFLEGYSMLNRHAAGCHGPIDVPVRYRSA